MRKFIAVIVVLVVGLSFKALEYWSLADSALVKLQSKGPVGMFIVNLITSPYEVVATSGGGLTERSYEKLPSNLRTSNFIRVTQAPLMSALSLFTME